MSKYDAIVFRIFNGTNYEDRVFVRDLTKPIGNNCWVDATNLRDFITTHPRLRIINLNPEN